VTRAQAHSPPAADTDAAKADATSSLSELTAASRRLALVGLAKNTGKTVALTALLRELESQGRTVGVTSVGRDGEERDVIDARIAKPRVQLAAGSLVATTDGLLRASGIAHELLEEPGIRTPLGRVLIARLRAPGTIEVAGPSAAADVRGVSYAMLSHGAERVLIDGAVDRRAASSPDVSDGLVMATGAILSSDIDEVVAQTRDAVELVRLPLIDGASEAGRSLRTFAASVRGGSMLLAAGADPVALPPRLILTADPGQIAELLHEHSDARWLLVAGALPERFLSGLLAPLRSAGRELDVVVTDPTKVFLWKRSADWYRRQGVRLQALERIRLAALTVNPVAPQSHRFDSADLRSRLARAIPEMPIFDVLSAEYPAAREPASAT
jgi:hypothetical protein